LVRRSAIAPLLCAAACSFDPSTTHEFLDDGAPIPDGNLSAQDAAPGSPDAGVAADAAAAECLTYTAFSTPALIPEVSSSSLDNAPTLSPDELTMILHSTRGGGLGGRDLWMATRSSLGAPFATPVNMNEVNSSSNEFGPTLSSDGLELYFGSSRPGGQGNYDIWRAVRANTSLAFETPTLVPNVNTGSVEFFPVLSGDGLSLYFASNRGGGAGSYDTWVSTRATTTSEFTAPTNLSANNSSATDEAIGVSADGRHFFIQSQRGGGQGGYDVWMARRASTAVPFPAVSLVAEINSNSNDQATWLSLDGTRLYQSSDRGGSWSLYVSERSCMVTTDSL
jgi:Tol biopolymer transport system component